MIWVRSQDKEMLVEASNFRIFEGLDKGKVSYYTVDIDSDLPQHPFTFELGRYSTKEKALKVLDMIQEKITNRLKNELLVHVTTRSDLAYINGSAVFQMPQDDEVGA